MLGLTALAVESFIVVNGGVKAVLTAFLILIGKEI
jgi:hypothetical protein